jgi:ribosome-associated protein
MEEVRIHTEYIKLDQLLKLSGEAENGSAAKEMILQGQVTVNGSVELQRGKKLRPGDTVVVKSNEYLIMANS